MPFTPANVQVYTAAYAGALSGITSTVGKASNVPTVGSYVGAAEYAGAFAEVFDMLWNLTPTSLLDLDNIQGMSEEAWSRMAPLATMKIDGYPLTAIAQAMIKVLLAAKAYYAAEGITPPVIPGGASPGGSAGEVQVNNGSGGLGAASNVKGGSGYLSVGADPAVTGSLRLETVTSSGEWLSFKYNGGATYTALQMIAGGFYVGNAVFPTLILGDGAIVLNANTGSVYIEVGSAPKLTTTTADHRSAIPIYGDASPYGVHGKIPFTSMAYPATVTAAEYIYGTILCIDAAAGNIVFPLPSTDARAFTKFVINTGAGSKVIENGGSAGRTVTLATNEAAIILFDTRGAHAMGAPFAYTE